MLNDEGIFKLPEIQLKRALENDLKVMSYEPVMKDGFLYAEGSVPVLLVAHLDTVHREPATVICKTQKGNIWMSPQGIGGDDRCGVWIVMEILRSIRCSVLFCEQEEVGGVGAKKFVQSGITPDVNYIIEFDRKGSDDAVFYDCDNENFEDFIVGGGFKTDWGTFSDISIIAPALGIAAVNLSSGYWNPHTIGEFINFKTMRRVKEKSMALINTKTDFFPYIPKPVKSYYSGKSAYYGTYGTKWANSDYYYQNDGSLYYGYLPAETAGEASWREDAGFLKGGESALVDYDPTTAPTEDGPLGDVYEFPAGGAKNDPEMISSCYVFAAEFDGVVVDKNGDVVSDDGYGYQIDEYGDVYRAKTMDLLVYKPNLVAKDYFGQPAIFQSKWGMHTKWIFEEDAKKCSDGWFNEMP